MPCPVMPVAFDVHLILEVDGGRCDYAQSVNCRFRFLCRDCGDCSSMYDKLPKTVDKDIADD